MLEQIISALGSLKTYEWLFPVIGGAAGFLSTLYTWRTNRPRLRVITAVETDFSNEEYFEAVGEMAAPDSYRVTIHH